MRRIVMAMVAAVSLHSFGAAAAPPGGIPADRPDMVQRVQYWDQRPYDGGWQQRQQWREWRRERDESRIAEAARREAWRIEQEREQRRAWRHQNGYGPRYGQGW